MKIHFDIDKYFWGLGINLDLVSNIHAKYKYSIWINVLCLSIDIDFIKNKQFNNTNTTVEVIYSKKGTIIDFVNQWKKNNILDKNYYSLLI